MSIATRITKLLKADIHALLDTVEEPQVMLKQAIRDMEEEIYEKEQELHASEQAQEQLQNVQTELKTMVQEIEPRLDLCFEAEDERLAKSLLKKKMETQERAKEVQKQLTGVDAAIEKQHSELRSKKDRLQSIKDKAELYCAGVGRSEEHQVIGGISDEALEIAYLEEKKKRSAVSREL